MRPHCDRSGNAAKHKSFKAVAETRGTNKDTVGIPLFCCFAKFSLRVTISEYALNFDS
jgi:hypothetical protein